MHGLKSIAFLALCCLGAHTPGAHAQPAPVNDAKPIGPFVVDLHGSFTRLGGDAQLAASRGIPPEQLPSLGLGLEAGAHWYPLRLKRVTFGLGASWLSVRAATSPDLEKTPAAVAMVTRFTALTPQVSFNFGSKRGWSYISGGILTSVLSLDRKEAIRRSSPGLKTINYGGGARWFAKPHLAFSFDVRFYAVNPAVATPEYLGNPRRTLTVFSTGISIQ
jgi:hypothetical protein